MQALHAHPPPDRLLGSPRAVAVPRAVCRGAARSRPVPASCRAELPEAAGRSRRFGSRGRIIAEIVRRLHYGLRSHLMMCRSRQSDAAYPPAPARVMPSAPRAFHVIGRRRATRGATPRCPTGACDRVAMRSPNCQCGDLISDRSGFVNGKMRYSHHTTTAEMRFQRAERGDQNSGSGFLADAAAVPALLERPCLERALPAEHMPDA